MVSAAMLGSLLAGCGGGESESQGASTEPSKEASPAVAASAAPQKAKYKKLRVGFPGSGQAAIGDLSQIAEAKGYLKEELAPLVEAYELIPFSGSGPAINEAFATGELEIGIYGDTPNVTLKSKGIDTTVVGIGNAALDAAFVIPADSKITSISELKGKKVATGKGTFMHRTLGEGLASEGLKQSDIQFFQMNTTEAQNAIQANQIDATVITTTIALKLEETKTGKILVDGSKHPEWKGLNVMAAKTDFAKANPEIVTAYLKALHRAWEYAKANPKEVKEAWAKASGYSVASFDYQYPDNKLGEFFNPDPSSEIVKRLEYTKNFLLENELITKDVDVAKWVDRSYYEAALK
ncbi:MAG: ssuA 6 [Paenibacillaceae bacterium]|nr:ssuA 6 [Paenibacillaceae bacterium]